MKNNRQSITSAVIIVAVLFFVAPCPRAQDTQTSPPNNGDAIKKEIDQMTWYLNTTITLPDSQGKLVIPAGYGGILGNDAKRMDEIVNGKNTEGPTSEADIFSSDLKSQINFDFVRSGYVSEDDWATLDATKLLQSVIDATEEQNKERRTEKLSEMHVVRWLHEPTYAKNSHTAFWAIEATDTNGGDVVNSTALRLGREGFERLTLIANVADYKPVGSPLDLMLRAFSFSPGNTYENHLSTDKTAGYGIAALVGAVVGAKLVKVAAAGGLALFFKPILAFLSVLLTKAWVLLLAPFLFLKSLFTRCRRGAQKTATPSPPTGRNEPPSLG